MNGAGKSFYSPDIVGRAISQSATNQTFTPAVGVNFNSGMGVVGNTGQQYTTTPGDGALFIGTCFDSTSGSMSLPDGYSLLVNNQVSTPTIVAGFSNVGLGIQPVATATFINGTGNTVFTQLGCFRPGPISIINTGASNLTSSSASPVLNVLMSGPMNTGNFIAIFSDTSYSSASVSSISDTAGNSFVRLDSITGTPGKLSFWYCSGGASTSGANTITLHYTGNVGSNYFRVNIFELENVNSNLPIDVYGMDSIAAGGFSTCNFGDNTSGGSVVRFDNDYVLIAGSASSAPSTANTIEQISQVSPVTNPKVGTITVLANMQAPTNPFGVVAIPTLVFAVALRNSNSASQVSSTSDNMNFTTHLQRAVAHPRASSDTTSASELSGVNMAFPRALTDSEFSLVSDSNKMNILRARIFTDATFSLVGEGIHKLQAYVRFPIETTYSFFRDLAFHVSSSIFGPKSRGLVTYEIFSHGPDPILTEQPLFQEGTLAEFIGYFWDTNGNPVNPTAVFFDYITPGGSSYTLSFDGSASGVQKIQDGQYSYLFDMSASSGDDWSWRWRSKGAFQSSLSYHLFSVEPTGTGFSPSGSSLRAILDWVLLPGELFPPIIGGSLTTQGIGVYPQNSNVYIDQDYSITFADGEVVSFGASFTDTNGNFINPDNVVLELSLPDGTTRLYDFPSTGDPAITMVDTGMYIANIDVSGIDGLVGWAYYSRGNYQSAMNYSYFLVSSTDYDI